jgi:NAD(P)-dependent dehydrogenase (short-subunit alcohol dehydrogenase family)
VVTLSSSGYRLGAIDFDDLQWQRRRYKRWSAYGQSKLANLLFTAELQRKLIGVGSSVKANAAHPGYAATHLQFHSGNRVMDALSWVGNDLIAQDADGGALPTLYAAVADIPGNSFAGPSGVIKWRGGATLVKRTAAAEDMDVARRLWQISEELTDVRFPLSAQPPSANGKAAGEAVPTLDASH